MFASLLIQKNISLFCYSYNIMLGYGKFDGEVEGLDKTELFYTWNLLSL